MPHNMVHTIHMVKPCHMVLQEVPGYYHNVKPQVTVKTVAYLKKLFNYLTNPMEQNTS